jgi:hypothetical protein
MDQDVVHHDLMFGVYKIHGFSQLYQCWVFDDWETAFDKFVGLGPLFVRCAICVRCAMRITVIIAATN